MSDEFTSLKCANCGAQLQVYDDMDQFACGYCKTEMLVQRRGGTVSLKAITAALSNIQVGTDRTADELSLVRLENELAGLKKQQLAEIQSFDSKLMWPPLLIMFGGLFAGVLLAGSTKQPSFILVAGVASMVIGLLVFIRGRQERSAFVAAPSIITTM